jgi:hypothetical protein
MDEPRDPAKATSEDGNEAGGATGQASGLDLEAGGHEPAPPSEDPDTQEAREGIQHEFDTLEATVSSDAVWDEAARRADEEPAPGTPTGDAAVGGSAAGSPAVDATPTSSEAR